MVQLTFLYESFFVTENEGPLLERETERTAKWAKSIVKQ